MGVQVTNSPNVVGSETVTGTFSHTGATAGFYGVAPVARAGAIAAPNAQSVAYVQADAQSIVTAVNSIRAALTAMGITS